MPSWEKLENEKTSIKTRLITLLSLCGIVLFILFWIESMIWLAQNPKANQMTIWTHLPDVITLQKLEKFQ